MRSFLHASVPDLTSHHMRAPTLASQHSPSPSRRGRVEHAALLYEREPYDTHRITLRSRSSAKGTETTASCTYPAPCSPCLCMIMDPTEKAKLAL